MSYFLSIFALIVLIFLISIYTLFATLFLNTNIDPQATLYGVFGDTVGGILNPILTFITFLTILFGLWLQGQELRSTREELSRAANAHENNLENLKVQISNNLINTFENTLFSLIQIKNQILIELKKEPKKISIEFRIGQNLSPFERTIQTINNSASLKEVQPYLWNNKDGITRYLRTFIQILILIEDGFPKISDDNLNKKQFY